MLAENQRRRESVTKSWRATVVLLDQPVWQKDFADVTDGSLELRGTETSLRTNQAAIERALWSDWRLRGHASEWNESGRHCHRL
jgi:hypothetical protein